jgi:hypothetical protein
MNPNPYKPPDQAGYEPAPAKPYTRFWFILDLFWIGSAAIPAIYEIVLEWLCGFELPDEFSLLSGILLLVLFLFLNLFFIVSFVVNIVGSIKGRRMSIAGVIANIVSLVCLVIPGP